jgi:hypothetical protein
MIVAGSDVWFHLSEAGKATLGEIAPESGVFEAYVYGQDDQGLWVVMDNEPKQSSQIMLIKWEHFSTLVMRIPPTRPRRNPVGFR